MPNFADPEVACESLSQAAKLNHEDPVRHGATLRFGAAGQVVMTGDMHGNLKNFEKLQRFCNLEKSPGRCVILHELIHQELTTPGQLDLSIDLLVRAAHWKCEFPDNVFFLQSNHELAQLRGQEITKGGRCVLHDFEQGVLARYANRAADVLDAARAYMGSLPLAARTASGVFMSHSLPDPMVLENFDIGVFDRVPDQADMSPGGPGYSLVWGRFHSPREVERFAQRLGVECFLVGHTPQETGYNIIGRLMIVASDHNHGVFLPIDLSRQYTMEQLERSLRKFVSVE